jgi:hypothetical protein
MSLEERVEFADLCDADYLLSIHLNGDDGYARGALALVPRGKYRPDQAKASTLTAEACLAELEALGMANLGTSVRLGTDRYAEMELLQKTVFIYPQEAGKTISVKTKNAVDTFDHRTSNSCLLFMDSILVLFFAAVNDIVDDEWEKL